MASLERELPLNPAQAAGDACFTILMLVLTGGSGTIAAAAGGTGEAPPAAKS